MYNRAHPGHIEVVCGSMFSGKTEELVRRVKRAQIGKQKVQVFKPVIDLVEEKKETHLLTLFKPQFEALKSEVGKGGIIKDKSIHEALLLGYTENVSNLGLFARGITYSPITGSAGNIEFWFDLTFNEDDEGHVTEEIIRHVIEEAHIKFSRGSK